MILKDIGFQDMYTSLDDLSDAEIAELLDDPEKEEKEVAEMYAKWEEDDLEVVTSQTLRKKLKSLGKDKYGNGTEMLTVLVSKDHRNAK